MITLSYRPLYSDSVVLLRGAYFRIGADGVLRGPDNAVVAGYSDGAWRFARSLCRILECRDTAYLRVTSLDGARKCIGPYQCLKVVAGGAVFTNETYLGAHALGRSGFTETEIWREITILSAAEKNQQTRGAVGFGLTLS